MSKKRGVEKEKEKERERERERGRMCFIDSLPYAMDTSSHTTHI